MKRTKKVIASKPDIEIYWRVHDGEHVRMWRNDWYGDQFEVVTIVAFQDCSTFCKLFSIPLIEADPD